MISATKDFETWKNVITNDRGLGGGSTVAQSVERA